MRSPPGHQRALGQRPGGDPTLTDRSRAAPRIIINCKITTLTFHAGGDAKKCRERKLRKAARPPKEGMIEKIHHGAPETYGVRVPMRREDMLLIRVDLSGRGGVEEARLETN